MKFLVDTNVGKLAKLLRLLGYDTLLFAEGDDNSLVSLALAHNRVILTKDHEFLRRRLTAAGRLRVLLIKSDDAGGQLRQVIEHFRLDTSHAFSRCLECNEILQSKEKAELQGRLPPYVYHTHEEFRECPSCYRPYWRGTHWQAMTRRLDNLVTQGK
ncbi:MAG: Mut7-C RNAse domain-containing protein [Chloroflexota bacterium]